MTSGTEKPNVFHYTDFCRFLNDLYKFRKRHEVSFSYEKWASEMGIKSRSYLRALCQGEKKPTTNLIPNLLQGLNFSDDEVSYFINLMNLASAPDEKIRAIYTKEVFRRWNQNIKETEVTEISEFLSDPMTPQLFTYLSFEDSPQNLEQWARDLQCSPQRIQKALRCLIWQKLVEGSIRENGEICYKTVSPFFTIPAVAGNTHVRSFHLQGIKQAEAASSLPPETRKMYSTFFALSPDQFARAQNLIKAFNRQILALFEEKTIQGKKLYRLNQQLLSVSEVVQTETSV